MNWMSILGLCLIVLGTVFSFFGTVFSSKLSQQELTVKIQEKNNTIDNINTSNIKLIDQNSSLLSSTNDVSNTNKSLIAQNNGMLDRISKYQSDIEERNKKIDQLNSEIENIKEYSLYATLDIYGRDLTPGYGIKYTSDLSDRMNKILFEDNGRIFVKNDKSILKDIDEVIANYPNFPFGYWAKYDFLKKLGNIKWRESAEKAVYIFEITTSIKGHQPSQDDALKFLKKELATNS